MKIKAFEKPIYVTRPILPPLEKIYDRLGQIWKAQQLTNIGEFHRLLEERVKMELKASSLSLFNNGTNALLAAVDALEFSGQVITTPFTFAATPHCLTYRNIEPVFCDIDEQTMTLDPVRVEELIGPQTTGILGVHVYGIPCHVQELGELAKKHQLKILYDAAHAFGLEIQGKPIGSFGDISMFSFHATKLFHTAEGGCLVFNHPSHKTKADLLKNFGIKNEDEVELVGINGKMSEIHAAIGLEVLDVLESERIRRQKIRDRYQQNLGDIPGFQLLNAGSTSRDSLQYCILRVHSDAGVSRDHLYHELKKYNVFTRKYFYPLCSQYKCYQHLESARPESLPVAHRVSKEVLSLPFYGDLTMDDVDQISELMMEVRRNV